MTADAGSPTLSFSRDGDATLVAHLGGRWQLQRDMPSAAAIERELAATPPARLTFDTAALGAWDSSLLTFVADVTELCARRHVTVERDGLPTGAQRLVALAEAVPERQGARQGVTVPPWLGRIGLSVLAAREPVRAMLGFIGLKVLPRRQRRGDRGVAAHREGQHYPLLALVEPFAWPAFNEPRQRTG